MTSDSVTVISVLGGLSSVRIQIPGGETEALEGKQKDHFPQSGEMADYQAMAGGFPTGLSFSTARRRGLSASATLGKPLTRESLVTLTRIFRRRRAVAFMPRGRLACRGSLHPGRLSRPSHFFYKPLSECVSTIFEKNKQTLTSGRQMPAAHAFSSPFSAGHNESAPVIPRAHETDGADQHKQKTPE